MFLSGIFICPILCLYLGKKLSFQWLRKQMKNGVSFHIWSSEFLSAWLLKHHVLTIFWLYIRNYTHRSQNCTWARMRLMLPSQNIWRIFIFCAKTSIQTLKKDYLQDVIFSLWPVIVIFDILTDDNKKPSIARKRALIVVFLFSLKIWPMIYF